MTGRGREISEVCKERNIDILCVQDTRWSGKSARELLEGYKIYYSGEGNRRNGIGIILSPKYKEGVIEVERVSDRLMKMKLVIAGELLNMFMENFERIIQDISESEKVLVGADLNGHVGQRSDGYQRVHGGREENQRRDGEDCPPVEGPLPDINEKEVEEAMKKMRTGGQQSALDYQWTC
ncbi:uncharacterized protein LOC134767066 [Penaeus indicus]|uniref:uncharacterized protein LOC134767066 n=1 Tax=Penaeus indicus TaxID=29960 RepID=UPI00300D358C